jgi:hypothetical protein
MFIPDLVLFIQDQKGNRCHPVPGSETLVFFSVADPGYLSRIPPFSIPDPESASKNVGI